METGNVDEKRDGPYEVGRARGLGLGLSHWDVRPRVSRKTLHKVLGVGFGLSL